jgi:two-component system chemotaxis response regulator CheY
VRNSNSPVTRFVPIIMLSGHSERRCVMEARDAGVTEFLTKPVAAKSLYERILSVVLAPRPFIRTKDYFGPDRRRTVNAKYAGPERRKGSEDAEIIEVAPIDNRLQQQRKQANAGSPALQPDTAA